MEERVMNMGKSQSEAMPVQGWGNFIGHLLERML